MSISEICVLKLKVVKSELLYHTYRWQVSPFKTFKIDFLGHVCKDKESR